MDIRITSLDGSDAGSITLADEVFNLEPRTDILHRVVRWQLAKRRAGTHKTKLRGEVSATTKKMYKQKGTGGARHGAKSAPQFRGGGRSFGPVVRSHAHDLPKKVRALGLKHALSVKARESDLVIVEGFTLEAAKTKMFREQLGKLGALSGALLIGGATIDENVQKAARNIEHIDVLPVQGINVYDIMRRQKLVLTRAAVDALQERLR